MNATAPDARPDPKATAQGRPRRPNFLRIIGTGALFGFIVGAVVSATHLLQNDDNIPTGYVYSESAGIGYLGMLGAVIFGLLATLLALYLDRRSRS